MRDTLRASLYEMIQVKGGRAKHDLPWVACFIRLSACSDSHTEGREEGGQRELGGDSREESLVSSSGLTHTAT